MNNYVTFQAPDLGVIIGNSVNSMVNGVLLYKPVNAGVPFDMPYSELCDFITPKAPYIRFHYDAVRQVLVNDKSVWQNRNSFDKIFHGRNHSTYDFIGRGHVEITIDEIELLEEDFLNILINKPLSLEVTERFSLGPSFGVKTL